MVQNAHSKMFIIKWDTTENSIFLLASRSLYNIFWKKTLPSLSSCLLLIPDHAKIFQLSSHSMMSMYIIAHFDALVASTARLHTQRNSFNHSFSVKWSFDKGIQLVEPKIHGKLIGIYYDNHWTLEWQNEFNWKSQILATHKKNRFSI